MPIHPHPLPNLVQSQESSFCSLRSPTSFLLRGLLRMCFLLLEQVPAPLAPTHPVGLSLNIISPSEAFLDSPPPIQISPGSLCCSFLSHPGFLLQFVLIESLVPLLFRNHICFVYLAHSRSPVITCGKKKWVSGFPLAPPRASVSPGERRCGWPSLLSQGGHCPWPWQDPHSYFGPLCCPVLPGTSGDHAKGVSWVRACHGPTHWLLAVLQLPWWWRLGIWSAGAGWKMPPGYGNVFPGGCWHLASWQRNERSFVLAWSRVYLLQEGSGPPWSCL